MTNRIWFGTIVGLCCLTATAQEPARVGVGVIERRMALEDVLKMALGNNLELEIQRTEVSNARLAIDAARGAFDGIFRWQPGYERRNTPTSSLLFGADGKLAENFHNQNFSFVQRMPWHGGQVQASFNNNRTATTNPFVGLNPTVTSQFVMQYTQPLLRNRKTDRERTEIVVRSKQADVSEVDLDLRVTDVVVRTEMAYWDLVAARQDVTVKAESVSVAREQVDRNKRMIDAGTLAPVELAASEAELARREDTYHAAVGVVTEVENSLKTLIAGGRQDDIWKDAIVPSEENTVERPESNLNAAVSTALSRRRELRELTLRNEINGTQADLAKDQLRPQVNLVGAYISTGLAGSQASTSNPFSEANVLTATRLNELSAIAGLPPLPTDGFGSGVPTSLVGGYGSALSGLFGGSYQSVQVGISLDWNVRNRAALSALGQTAVNERRLKFERARTEQAIESQVRNALQALETARQRITASEAAVKAAKEKLDSETRLFQSGESTNFFVLTRQNEYSDSMRRLVVSRLEYNKAVARLHLALGTTLETHQISVR
ncbi:MAG: TolC family protein [Bryobacteraceae bacterium]